MRIQRQSMTEAEQRQVVDGLLTRLAGTQSPSVMLRYEQGPLVTALRHLAPCLSSEARILDVGCGSGWLLEGLASLGTKAIGIDIDGRRLREAGSPIASGDGWAHRIVADATRLPFPDRSFDAVLSVSVLQYTDWRATVAECGRVLKEGGRAVFIENLHGHPLARLYRMVRRTFFPYQPNLVPRRHLRWTELHAFTKVFGDAEARAHGLFTPALALPAVFSALPGGGRRPLENGPARDGNDGGLGEKTRVVFDLMEGIDDAVFARLKVAERLAWMATITCTNRSASS